MLKFSVSRLLLPLRTLGTGNLSMTFSISKRYGGSQILRGIIPKSFLKSNLSSSINRTSLWSSKGGIRLSIYKSSLNNYISSPERLPWKRRSAKMLRENSRGISSTYEEWADSMENRYDAKAGQQPSRTEPCTIHRVPHSIRIVDEGSYEPKMLSIGPYHRSNPKLKAMEDHKWHCLRGVLRRYPERRLSYYLKEMEGLEVQVRGFYSENEEIKRIGSKEFVEMMLLDGFYILELLLDVESENAAGRVNDPIYSTNWILPIIRLDMLLLENQLPFLVLRHLFQFVNGSNNNSCLVELAVQFFHHVMPIKREEVARVDSFHHLLHLFHWHLLPVTSPDSRVTVGNIHRQSRSPPYIPSATEIQYPGITLRRTEGASSIPVVELGERVMKVPHISINHSTNSIFRNLIAWEQCYPACGNYFTSYAIFMDCLIDTPKDVVVLKRRKIIEHWLGNDEQVALLFNKLCIGITINSASGSSFLYDLSVRVEEFQKKRFNLWRGQLMRYYFADPWAIIKLYFTMMTIILTFVQTFPLYFPINDLHKYKVC